MEPPQRSDAEQGVLDVLIAATSPPPPPHGPGDDCALLGEGQVVTVDMLVEGVHFDDRLSPSDVGYKAVAVSVSDVAAMGARPTWLLLSLALPAPLDAVWAGQFAEGVGAACRRWRLALVGGDTVRSSGPRVASVTMGATCVAAPMLRSGGRVGDDLWVTGTLGRAGAGWATSTPTEQSLGALRRPDPPIAFALDLAAAGLATAAMDLSDGLARDLPRLCAASGCGARVDGRAVPADDADGDLAWTGGDDYELLFAASPTDRGAIAATAARHGVRVTRIGALDAGPVRVDGRSWPTPRFEHWS
jgi:thiamine-monophosphate kinase